MLQVGRSKSKAATRELGGGLKAFCEAATRIPSDTRPRSFGYSSVSKVSQDYSQDLSEQVQFGFI